MANVNVRIDGNIKTKAEVPNKVTMDAINELDDMKNDSNKYETYHSSDELIEDLLK